MKVFITGITGTLGTVLASLHHQRGDQVWGCARSESKAVEWLRNHSNKATLFLCDAKSLGEPNSDVGRLIRHWSNDSRVYHCAAMKHVDLCEANPLEALEQNVRLAAIVAMTCAELNIPLIHVSSDKACLPQGVYGATKFLSEQIALREGAAVVRLGNLIGSSGSVFASWSAAVKDNKPIYLTSPNATRYFIRTEDAAKFLAEEAVPGSIAIPYPMRSIRMGAVADALLGKITITGLRPGETLHQHLTAPSDRLLYLPGKIIISKEGTMQPVGLNSSNAPQWEPFALLTAAWV